jgi:hypothetical protein
LPNEIVVRFTQVFFDAAVCGPLTLDGTASGGDFLTGSRLFHWQKKDRIGGLFH